MQTASDLALSRCMADVGFADSIVFGPTAMGDGSSLNYGVWSRDEVRQYGYAVHVEDVIEWSDPPGSMNLSSPQAEAAMFACVDQVDAMGLALRPGPPGDDDARPEAPTESSQTAEGRAVIAEWTACLVAHDVPSPDPEALFQPRGVEQLDLAEQVRIGLIDIDCKEATNFRQRLADIDAVIQQAFIDAHPDYVASVRATRDRTVAAATAYLVAAGIEVP